MVELADSLDSGSSAHYGRAGSSPASRTKEDSRLAVSFFILFPLHQIFLLQQQKNQSKSALTLLFKYFTVIKYIAVKTISFPLEISHEKHAFQTQAAHPQRY